MAEITADQLDKLNKLLSNLDKTLKKGTSSGGGGTGGGASFGGSYRDYESSYEDLSKENKEMEQKLKLQKEILHVSRLSAEARALSIPEEEKKLEQLQAQLVLLTEQSEARREELEAKEDLNASQKEELRNLGENLKKQTENLQYLASISQEKIKAANLDDESIKNAEKESVELKKHVKLQRQKNKELEEQEERYENAHAHAEELGKSMGRMMGLKEPSKGGIGGVLKDLTSGDKLLKQDALDGITSGFKKMFTGSNLLISGLQKLAEASAFVFLRFDQQNAAFAKLTGTGREYISATRDASAATQGLIANQGELLESAGKLQNSLAGVSGFSRLQISALAELQVATERLGVSSDDFTDIMKTQQITMGRSTKESKQGFADLQAAAQNMGMTFGELTSQFRGSASSFAAFGSSMDKVFIRTASTARQLGLELGDVVALGEQFDTFEGASEMVSELNYMMGGQFLDSMELMTLQAEKGPHAVTAAIKEQFNSTGKAFEDFTYHQQKQMAQAMNMSVDQASKFLKSPLDISKVDGAAKAQGDMKNLMKLANSTMTIMEKLATIVTSALESLGSGLDSVVNGISNLVGGMGDGAKTLTKAGVGLGIGASILGGGAMMMRKKKGQSINPVDIAKGSASGFLEGLKKGGLKGGLKGALMGGAGAAVKGKLGTEGNPMFVKVVGGGMGGDMLNDIMPKSGGKGGKGKDFLKTGKKGERFRINKKGEIYSSSERLAKAKAAKAAKVPNLKVHTVADQAAKSGINKAIPKKPGFFGGLLKKMNPIGNVSEVLKGGVAKNAGKILKTATGPIVKTIMNLAEFGMILSSDDDKKTKSKRLVSASGGLLGGIIGGVAAGTLGAIGGPASMILGGLGAMAGDYLGRMMFGMPAVQNLLAPLVEEHVLGGDSTPKTPKAAPTPTAPKPAKQSLQKKKPAETGMSMIPKSQQQELAKKKTAKPKQAAKLKLPSAKEVVKAAAAGSLGANLSKKDIKKINSKGKLKQISDEELDAIPWEDDMDVDPGSQRNAQGGYDFVKDPVTGGMKQVQPKANPLEDQRYLDAINRITTSGKYRNPGSMKAAAKGRALRGDWEGVAKFQAGGSVLQGGMALVGEKGPEMVSLPRGAYVTPNDAFAKAGAPSPQAQAQGNASSQPTAINVSINVDDRRLREVFQATVEQVITGA